jgi:hypothetical protein
MTATRSALFFALSTALPRAAQTPTVASVVNYASSDARLSPGVLATVTGTNLGATTLQVGTSAPFPVVLAAYAPGLFTTATHTTGATINAAAPASAGETISLYATGLGATNPAVAAGVVSPASPVSATVALPNVTVSGTVAPVLGSVLTPGQIGLYQINIQLPTTLAAGNLPFVLTIGGLSSNTLTLPVGGVNTPDNVLLYIAGK